MRWLNRYHSPSDVLVTNGTISNLLILSTRIIKNTAVSIRYTVSVMDVIKKAIIDCNIMHIAAWFKNWYDHSIERTSVSNVGK